MSRSGALCSTDYYKNDLEKFEMLLLSYDKFLKVQNYSVLTHIVFVNSEIVDKNI